MVHRTVNLQSLKVGNWRVLIKRYQFTISPWHSSTAVTLW